MKILIVGGTGTIGKAVGKELSKRHEVISAGLKDGDLQVDITDLTSIKNMYESIKNIDAVIATTGEVHFGLLTEMNENLYNIGLKNKLMGQVNLVLIGLKHINKNGSFTLTSGILNNDPIKRGSSAAMVNGALEGFVKSAAIEMPNNIRINVISPTILKESMDKYKEYFYGFMPVSSEQAALAYSKSVEGAQSGQIYCVGY